MVVIGQIRVVQTQQRLVLVFRLFWDIAVVL